MKTISISGKLRSDLGKKASKMYRAQGLVPCVMYGEQKDEQGNPVATHFLVSDKEIDKCVYTPNIYLVKVTIDGVEHKAVMREIQFHPVKDNCLHVDFLAVNEEKPITINVPLSFTGHPVGVQKGGKFVVNARSLKVKAVMANLPDELTIDTTDLDIEKRIVAGDLAFENIEVVSSKNTIVCTVKATRQAKQAGA